MGLERAAPFVLALVGVALSLQSLELLLLQKYFRLGGIWSWSALKADYRATPRLQRLLSYFLDDKAFQVILSLRLCLSLVALGEAIAFPERRLFIFITVCLLFVLSLLVCVRFRGTFNGGSDYMSLQLLVSLCGYFSSASPFIQQGAILYLVFQLVLSYFISGMAKLRNLEWRRGEALSIYLLETSYLVPELVKKQVRSKNISRLGAWAMISFECLFPLAIFSHRLALIFMVLGILFHLATFMVIGLNRFFWVWLAAYPALYFLGLR